MKYRFKKTKAFTLAEVLITLGIIGVVAGITIPTLVQNTQNAEFKTAMKKNFSIFSGVYERIKAENGTFQDILVNCTNGDHNCFKNALKQYLSYVRDCDSNSSKGVCFPVTLRQLNNSVPSYAFQDSNTAGLVLKDGTSVAIFLDTVNCTTPRNTFTDECGWVTIDVNGLKGPNVFGKDAYTFMFYKDRVRPYGTQGDGASCTASSSYGCTAQYLYQ